MFVVAGSIQHESNTFCPSKCIYEDFYRAYGTDMLSKIAPTEFFNSMGVELCPTLYASSVPSGIVERESFESLLDEMLSRFPVGRSIDGVWLYLHGAMEVEEIGSGDTAILAAVRRRVGLGVPISLALDFHANNTYGIVHDANIVCGYRTAPHTDMADTQIRAARLLVECIERGVCPKSVMVSVPLICAGDMVITAVEPMRSIIAQSIRLESEEGILTASVFNGQPWVDAENTCTSAVVVAQSDAYYHIAQRHAETLANMLWDARDKYRFQVDALDGEDAVEAAMKEVDGLVFISDSGDNTTAGARGSSAYLLKQLIHCGAYHTLLAGITSPKVVDDCRKLSSGDKVAVALGEPVDGPEGSVAFSAILVRKSRMTGWDGEDGGDAVLLSIPGIDIIVTARSCAAISPEIIESAGAQLRDYMIVVVKLGYLFPKLEVVAAKAILALTPGVSCEAIEKIGYTSIRRPSWPIDKDLEWTAGLK